MAYGTVKVDNITFDNGGSDQNVTVSGLYRATTSGVTVTGTISGAVLVGTTTVSGATVTGNVVQGTTVQGVSGTFTSLTGTTTTGTTANFASGVFTTRVSGTIITGDTGQFTSGTFVSLTGTTITGTTINGVTVAATTGSFTSLTGTTTSGTTANFVSGVFTTQVSGTTVTGTTSNFTSGNFATLSGATATFTSGVIALGTATNPSLSFVGDPNTGIYSPGADQLAVATNGTEKLIVLSNGNVGIGTSSPASALDVSGGSIKLRNASSGTNYGYEVDINHVTGVSQKMLNARYMIAGASGSYAEIAGINAEIENADFNVYGMSFRTGGSLTERVRITGAGAVGIGTTSPGQPLEVLGTIYSQNNATTIVHFQAADNGAATDEKTWRVAQTFRSTKALGLGVAVNDASSIANAPILIVRNGAGIDNIQFATSANERARIDSSGRLLVGTTTSTATYPGRLVLSDLGATLTTGSAGLEFYSDATSGGFGHRIISAFDGASNYYLAFQSRQGNAAWTTPMYITGAGNIVIGQHFGSYNLTLANDSAAKPSTNTWTISSDERIKEDIELADLDLCYQAVKNIPLKRFKWKDEVYTEEQVKDRRKLGWIAQDVEAVFPKAVGTYEFKYNQVFEETIIPAIEEVLDDEGNVTTPAQPERIEKGELISEDVIEDCRDLNSDQIYAAMYGAIQKLMIKVETLEIELALLKAQ